MPKHSTHSNAVRRIVLPSGRTIEVVRFNQPQQTAVRPLHVCPDCDCDMVQPHDWTESEDGGWELSLECPNCGWLETGEYDEHQIASLEDELDAGVELMLADLRRLAHANMASDVDSFIAALQCDLVLPEDF
ncbi:MAG: hypothetical protein J2O48_09575 [Solirubrobacterales bacterium]|nr:hypothetical protein [Solirubrobacterales bacterium]